MEKAELTTLEIGRKGLAGLAGKYRDDPVLQDICDEAYRLREADDAEAWLKLIDKRSMEKMIERVDDIFP